MGGAIGTPRRRRPIRQAPGRIQARSKSVPGRIQAGSELGPGQTQTSSKPGPDQNQTKFRSAPSRFQLCSEFPAAGDIPVPCGPSTRRALEWSKRRRFGNPDCLNMIIRTNRQLGKRLRSPFSFPMIRSLSLSTIAKPALFWQEPAVFASRQDFPWPSSAVNGMRQSVAHFFQPACSAEPKVPLQANPIPDARTAAKRKGIPIRAERLPSRPGHAQNLACRARSPAFPSAKPFYASR